MTPEEEQEELAKFDELGEDEVRKRLDAGYICHPKRVALAAGWLRRQEKTASEERERHLAKQQAEEMEIARSAKEAAWESAKAAKRANELSARSNLIAWIALAIALVALITPFALRSEDRVSPSPAPAPEYQPVPD